MRQTFTEKIVQKVMAIGSVPADVINRFWAFEQAASIQILPRDMDRLQVRRFDMEYTYKYSFINQFFSRQLKVLIYKNFSNRIFVFILDLDI